MKRTALVIGNWKLNPQTVSEAVLLAGAVAKKHRGTTTVAIAPPFLYLTEVKKKLGKSRTLLAAQDVSTEPLGPFTGDVSAMQLRNAGTEYVIIGHSERRARGESDEAVQKKIAIALKNKLTPVVCIGERERDSQGAFFSFVEAQLRSLANGLDAATIKKIVIAYEPIWAIGTGKTATPADVKEMQLFLFSVLTKLYDRPTAGKVILLYGGSVKADNARELHTEGDMNGFLVGGASLKADEFLTIIKSTEIE
ncbi:MAG TPA: triose-phosphate isomerase [Candidatus Paceibacterota bacterium]